MDVAERAPKAALPRKGMVKVLPGGVVLEQGMDFHMRDDEGSEEEQRRRADLTAAGDRLRAEMDTKIGERVTKEVDRIRAEIDGKFENLSVESRKTVADFVTAEIERIRADSLSSPHEPLKWKDDTSGQYKRVALIDMPRRAAGRQVTHLHQRAIDQQANVPGGIVDHWEPWRALVEENPFRPFVLLMPITGGAATLPKLSESKFVAEGTHPVNAPRTPGGDLTVRTVALTNYTNEMFASNVSLNDVPMLPQIVLEEIMNQAGFVGGAEVFAALKASVNGGAGTFARVPTGAAAALPDADAVFGVLNQMVTALPSPYRFGAVWHISRGLESIIAQHTTGTGGMYGWDPREGVMKIRGYPVEVNDHMEMGNAANHVSAAFGNFRKGLIFSEGTPMIYGEPYAQTRPGGITWFSQLRCTASQRDDRALIGLSTRAS